ncbi:MAG: cytochrome c oxidase subunit II [Acidobacteria bacterium RIFCSPLOWO2_02_FULL_67_36]|nr:MAG: cytochrome c oxidase subunit II [Acidobacteria bacterium RIFCSPLOWO2_02_FULL_67_36]OFW18574.1 MAG: cytochrome c oxidase subunit II [Acidobacteria bacterium RIFCSPLOWO2_12_FULL_66_21]
MFTNFPLFPHQASAQAAQVDNLYFFLLSVTAFFSLLIATLVVVFAIKYRRRHRDEVGVAIHGSLALEMLWTIIPFFIVMVMFVWGAKVFFDIYRPVAGSMEIYVVGKQWMWKVQHMDGQKEINELHVPVGRPVKLVMASEDVIHDFFIPAFRVKADVVPGRYNHLSFTATKAGTYHLFCAQYCGTRHSGMIGSVIAMEPADFQAWLSGGRATDSPLASGEKLFQDLACSTCHRSDTQGRGPMLANLFGKSVELQSGGTAVADEAYLRESIVNPQAKIVAGFQPLMPTFQGLVSEEQILQLIAYVRSLSAQGAAPAPAGTSAPTLPQQSDRPVKEKK